MSKLVLVQITQSDQVVGLYKNGQLVLSAGHESGIQASVVEDAADRLSEADSVPLVTINYETSGKSWTWDQVTMDLIEAGVLGYFNMTHYEQWQALYEPGEARTPYPRWLEAKQEAERRQSYDESISSSLKTVFGEEACAIEQGDESFDITVCLSAHQRLCCFVELTVPGSCTQDQVNELVGFLDSDMDAQAYDVDEEYWEGCEPYVEGFSE